MSGRKVVFLLTWYVFSQLIGEGLLSFKWCCDNIDIADRTALTPEVEPHQPGEWNTV